jgi:hypothetical protein
VTRCFIKLPIQTREVEFTRSRLYLIPVGGDANVSNGQVLNNGGVGRRAILSQPLGLATGKIDPVYRVALGLALIPGGAIDEEGSGDGREA